MYSALAFVDALNTLGYVSVRVYTLLLRNVFVPADSVHAVTHQVRLMLRLSLGLRFGLSSDGLDWPDMLSDAAHHVVESKLECRGFDVDCDER